MSDRDNNFKSQVRSTIEEGADHAREAVDTVERKARQSQSEVIRRISDLDRKAHENPWTLVAGTAFSCLLLGLILGKSKN